MSGAEDAWALGGLADIWSGILNGFAPDKMALNRIAGAEWGPAMLSQLMGQGLNYKQAMQQLSAQRGIESEKNANVFDTAALKGRFDLAGKGMEQATERWKLPQQLAGQQSVANIQAGGQVGAAQEQAGAARYGSEQQAGAHIQGAQTQADAARYAAEQQAAGHVQGAQEQAGATRYAADVNSAGRVAQGQSMQKQNEAEMGLAISHFKKIYKDPMDQLTALREYGRAQRNPNYTPQYPVIKKKSWWGSSPSSSLVNLGVNAWDQP